MSFQLSPKLLSGTELQEVCALRSGGMPESEGRFAEVILLLSLHSERQDAKVLLLEAELERALGEIERLDDRHTPPTGS
ncbi:hypothetical protein LCGC14_2894850 [marine sediment metagenome]|uniref:Uncharacterized protein n=1 Tax=marine sediment metagenome TaxID=412755 RepID=A0A0F9AM95_9ZZZZ